MSTTTLQFTLKVNDVLTDPDANTVTIPSPGVVRTDTSGVVVAGPVTMTRVSTGIYTYPVTDPALGLTYRWSAAWARAGVPQSLPFTVAGTASATPIYRYAWFTFQHILDVLGSVNDSIQADLDNSGDASTIARRNQAAGDNACDWLDDQLSGGIWTIPLVTSNGSDQRTTAYWMAIYAADWLLWPRRAVMEKAADAYHAERLRLEREEIPPYRTGIKRGFAGMARNGAKTSVQTVGQRDTNRVGLWCGGFAPLAW